MASLFKIRISLLAVFAVMGLCLCAGCGKSGDDSNVASDPPAAPKSPPPGAKAPSAGPAAVKPVAPPKGADGGPP